MSLNDQITQVTGPDDNDEATLKPTIKDPKQSQRVTQIEAIYREAKSDRKTWLIGVSVLVLKGSGAGGYGMFAISMPVALGPAVANTHLPRSQSQAEQHREHRLL
ncbi:hypothetical protein RU639_008591 [Aspergillus parasiticus]